MAKGHTDSEGKLKLPPFYKVNGKLKRVQCYREFSLVFPMENNSAVWIRGNDHPLNMAR